MAQISLKRREEVSNVSNEKYQIKVLSDGNGEPLYGASVVLKGHTETGVIPTLILMAISCWQYLLRKWRWVSLYRIWSVNVEAMVGTFVKVVMKESSQTLKWSGRSRLWYAKERISGWFGYRWWSPTNWKFPVPSCLQVLPDVYCVVAVQRSGEPGADGADFGFAVFLLSMAQGVHWLSLMVCKLRAVTECYRSGSYWEFLRVERCNGYSAFMVHVVQTVWWLSKPNRDVKVTKLSLIFV